MFDLEQAVADWRRKMLAAGIKTPVPLDELENHLRDDVEGQVQSGIGVEQAFDEAVLRIGHASALKGEFAKVEGLRRILKFKTVWALIAVAGFGCWLQFGNSPGLALAYGIVLTGLIVTTFVDFKHFIIPDEISIGGTLLGVLCSLLLPSLHGQKAFLAGGLQSALGIVVGAGVVYGVLRLGKLAFGRQRLAFAEETKILFTDRGLILPDKEIGYDELFYRKSDAVTLQARVVEVNGRIFTDAPIRLTPGSLQVGEERFVPAEVSRMEAVSAEINLPREAMGLGDVKLMAAIGAFLGWQAAIFSLVVSSFLGSAVGVGLIAVRRREWSSRVPYGPYIAVAAAIWIFAGKQLVELMFAP